jgi:hypothetical protein
MRWAFVACVSLGTASCDGCRQASPRQAPAATSTPTGASSVAARPSGSATTTTAATSTVPAPMASAQPNEWAWPPDYHPPEVWESKDVVVDGVKERWSLKWRDTPTFLGCAPAIGCYCDGVPWGIGGALMLVRDRPGNEAETLDISAAIHDEAELWRQDGTVLIQGFKEPRGFDFEHGFDDVDGPAGILKRVVGWDHADVMQLRDYDHDGESTEFVLKIGYLACGQDPSVVVGVSKGEPHLHVFHKSSTPKVPLVMTYMWSWEAMADTRAASLTIAQHECGDHGGAGDYMRVRFGPRGSISLSPDDFECDHVDSTTRPMRRLKRLPSGKEIEVAPRPPGP